MQQINYTIIIPHHNIPTLLERCLRSIPHREDVQVIVVDDKSDEKYLRELQCVERAFPWVTFIHSKEGKGAGFARNIGLQYAKGDFVFFADADDFFTYCIGNVFDDYKNCTCDAVFFNANSIDTDTYATTFRCLHLNDMINNYSKCPQKAVFELKFAFGEPWCKMVRRELIEQNKIRFSETIIHNDTRYSYLVGFYSREVKVDNRAIYCVTDRVGSVSKRISLDRLMTRTAIFTEANLFFKKHGIRRFDEHGIRPLLGFLIKGDFANIHQCFHIMRKQEMSSFSIVLYCLFYPFCFWKKRKLWLKKYLLKIINN